MPLFPIINQPWTFVWTLKNPPSPYSNSNNTLTRTTNNNANDYNNSNTDNNNNPMSNIQSQPRTWMTLTGMNQYNPNLNINHNQWEPSSSHHYPDQEHWSPPQRDYTQDWDQEHQPYPTHNLPLPLPSDSLNNPWPPPSRTIANHCQPLHINMTIHHIVTNTPTAGNEYNIQT